MKQNQGLFPQINFAQENSNFPQNLALQSEAATDYFHLEDRVPPGHWDLG